MTSGDVVHPNTSSTFALESGSLVQDKERSLVPTLGIARGREFFENLFGAESICSFVYPIDMTRLRNRCGL